MKTIFNLSKSKAINKTCTGGEWDKLKKIFILVAYFDPNFNVHSIGAKRDSIFFVGEVGGDMEKRKNFR